LAIQIAAYFRFVEDWYRGDPVVALVLAYYALLRSIVRVRPGLRRCLTRCRHCGIFFLTHPRNAGRRDLRCPFGCREAHRQRASTQRSVAYYRDEAGREKKRAQNAKRRKFPVPVEAPPSPLPAAPVAWSRRMLEYLCVVSGLIEGRRVRRAEVVAMLWRALRQQRMVRARRIDQTLAWLHEQPP
jgi:hypothetical protein